MSDPRKHHYVQRAYLAGFASDGWVHVFDRREGKTFRAKPQNVGLELDFYRIDKTTAIDDEFVVERDLFSRIDGDGFAALLRFADAPSRANRLTKELAMLYMAAAYLRTPRTREKTARLNDRMIKSMTKETCEDDQKFRRFVSYLPEEVRDSAEFDAKRMREFALAEDDYEVSLDRNWTVGLPLQAMIPIATRGLLPRHWAVMRARVGEHFVTGDSPLALRPVGSVPGPIVRLDAPNTIALFPVDRGRALVGKGEAGLREWPQGVSAVNGYTALNSHRHVYSSEAEFEWEDELGRVARSNRYLELGEPGPDVAAEAYPIPAGLSDGHRSQPAVRLANLGPWRGSARLHPGRPA